MTQSRSHDQSVFDVIVIGGGAAGLGGALALGRSRRSVLVLDAGEPRNAPAGHVHNYLGREGTPPLELLAIGRREVEEYGVHVATAHVAAVRTWDRPRTGFVVTLDDGRDVLARRLLVASGVTDVLPDIPGLADRWGRDVLHCAYCHGWEVRDRAIAVLATSALAVHQATLFRQLSDDVALVLASGAPLPSETDLDRLAVRGVRVVMDAPVEVLLREDESLHGLRLTSGDVLERDALVVSPLFHARAEFLAGLGLRPVPFEMGGQVLGTLLAAEPTGATAVSGVWAAGNVVDAMAQVVSSAAAGLRVGAQINAQLAEEDTDAALDAHGAELTALFEQPAWDERYAASEAVWSGRVNPQLIAEAAELAPGRALDVGSGEGADAIWLAARGWSVTGMDFSTVALQRAATHAAAAGVADIDWRHVDVRAFGATAREPTERWDLVTSQYMHLPDDGMVELTRRLAEAVAAGGTLLVVGHHPDDLHTGLRHGRHSFLFTPEQLVPALDADEWDIRVAGVRSRSVTGPEGQPVTVRDSVLRAVRRC